MTFHDWFCITVTLLVFYLVIDRLIVTTLWHQSQWFLVTPGLTLKVPMLRLNSCYKQLTLRRFLPCKGLLTAQSHMTAEHLDTGNYQWVYAHTQHSTLPLLPCSKKCNILLYWIIFCIYCIYSTRIFKLSQTFLLQWCTDLQRKNIVFNLLKIRYLILFSWVMFLGS